MRMAQRPTQVKNGMCEHGFCDGCPHGCFDKGSELLSPGSRPPSGRRYKVIIAAHTRHQVERFARRNGLQSKYIFFASDPYRLDGINNVVAIFLDGWEMHAQAAKVREKIEVASAAHDVHMIEMSDSEMLAQKIWGMCMQKQQPHAIRELLTLAFQRLRSTGE